MKNYCPERAINRWSCALACLVAVCKENGIFCDQGKIIEDYKKDYLHWVTEPGKLNDDQVIDLADKIGVAQKERSIIKHNPDKEDFINLYNEADTAGVLVGKHKDGDHCYKLIGISEGEIFSLMNPSTYGEQEELYDWEGLKDLKISIMVLKK